MCMWPDNPSSIYVIREEGEGEEKHFSVSYAVHLKASLNIKQ